MEKPSFNFVRTILNSQQFQSKNVEEQQEVLNKILQTGEVTLAELLTLIKEENNNREQRLDFSGFLNQLDYNTFVDFIQYGNIKGKDLINLCNSSKKLNEYCSRSFQPLNNQGMPYGEEQTEYLFRFLLEELNITIPKGISPKETYIKRVVRNFSHFGYSKIHKNKHIFTLAKREDEERENIKHKYRLEDGKRYYGSDEYKTVSRSELLQYLFTVKINIYVRVIISHRPNNIFLIKLNSPNINDVSRNKNGSLNMIALKSQPLEFNDDRIDVIVHYTELYPEILQWVFEDQVSKLNIDLLSYDELFYPFTRKNNTVYVSRHMPEIIGIPYGNIKGVNIKGMLRLLPNEIIFNIYGSSFRENKVSIIGTSLRSVRALLINDNETGNIKVMYNRDMDSNLTRFLNIWYLDNIQLYQIVFLAFFLQGSITRIL
jgi:hypothetical protein